VHYSTTLVYYYMLDLYSAFLGKSFIFKVRKEDCHRIHSSVVLIMALSKVKISKTIMRFRGKVIHDGEKNTFSDDETPYVRFLEILVYSMILKRVGIPDKEIELIIGVIFHCNYVAMENKTDYRR